SARAKWASACVSLKSSCSISAFGSLVRVDRTQAPSHRHRYARCGFLHSRPASRGNRLPARWRMHCQAARWHREQSKLRGNGQPFATLRLKVKGGCYATVAKVLSCLSRYREYYGHFTTGGMEDRMDSALPPVLRPKMVPRS